MDDNYTTTLSLDKEAAEKLKWLAKNDDRSIRGYLRRFITAYVNEEYDKKHPKSNTQVEPTESEVAVFDTVNTGSSFKEATTKIQDVEYDRIDKEWSSDVPKVKF